MNQRRRMQLTGDDFEIRSSRPTFCSRGECHIVGTALAIGLGVASAVSSVAGGALAKSGADNQADATLKAATMQVDENKRQFDVAQKNSAPWVGTGAAAEGRLAYLLGLNPQLGNSQASFTNNFGGQGTAYTVNGKTVIVPPGGQPPSGGVPTNTNQIPQFRPQGGKAAQLNPGGDGTPVRGGTIASGATAPQTTTPPTADSEYGSLLRDFTVDDFHKDPAYDFTLSEGQKALDRSAAAKGVLGSGTYLKDLTKYNQDFANTKYDESYNRFNNNRTMKYNFLAGPAGIGQQTASQVNNLGADYSRINGGLLSSANSDAARLRASGYSDLAGGIAGFIPTALGGYQGFKGLS